MRIAARWLWLVDMSDETRLTSGPMMRRQRRQKFTRLGRHAATSALLGALVIAGPWTVPAAGHDSQDAQDTQDSEDAALAAFGTAGPPALGGGLHGVHGPYDDFGYEDQDWAAQLLEGARSSPVTGFPVSASYGIPGGWAAGHHTGVDFATPTGTPVRSAGPGTVVLAGYAGDYGNAVLVRMTDGYYALYAHLSEISVREDEWVESGTELGQSGDSGRSTGPHLHFEIRTGTDYGTDVDPVAYLARHGVSVV
jgi:murein DD-endopeptidase MepM/ murein hydrolase activator NlpD